MINKQEIRYGNWLHHKAAGRVGNLVIATIVKADNYVKALEVRRDSIYTMDDEYFKGEIELEDLYGIPLTPEILEKAGFKNNHLFTTKFRFQCLDGYAYVRMSASTDSVYIDNIKYLHQLQNLYYSLMGEELEINL